MPLIGYARVSTGEQNLGPQLDALKAAGCTRIFEEHASGAMRSRPQLAYALGAIRKGDTLLVVRIDRLARSLAHLLEIVETLRSKAAHFRSLGDPIDTTGPSGVLVLQMLGAVAEFERSLIRERVKAGIAAAKLRGRAGGNIGLRNRDPAVIASLTTARRHARLMRLIPHSSEFLPVAQRLRPTQSWEKVLDAVNAALAKDRPRYTRERLVRSVKLLVREGMADKALLDPVPKRGRRRKPASVRAMELAAAFKSGRPKATLAEVAAELLRMKVLPPSGRVWAPSSVKALLDRAGLNSLAGALSR
jgi:DNA invertase Pin-like site-specific DNA recombinase